MTNSKLSLDALAVETFETIEIMAIDTTEEVGIMPTLGSCTCYDCTRYCQ